MPRRSRPASSAQELTPAVLKMLKENKDDDPYLRHAGVMALVGIGDRDAIKKAATHEIASIRLAACLAMRRLEMPEVAGMLNDFDKQVALEAARAIYDAPVTAALPRLAEMANQPLKDVSERIVLRVLAANYRLGTKSNAQALATLATRSDISTGRATGPQDAAPGKAGSAATVVGCGDRSRTPGFDVADVAARAPR